MKNLKQIILMFILCLSSLSVVVGCGEKSIESLTVKSGVQYTYAINDEFSFDDIKLDVLYNDGTQETITKDDVEIDLNGFTTATAGNYEVKVKYNGEEIKLKIKVTTQDEAYEIYEVEDNAAFVQYYAAIEEEVGEEVDPESVFAIRGKSEETAYVVGDDNEFTYELNLTALTPEGTYKEDVEATKTVTTFYVTDEYDGTYTKLSDTEAAAYVDVINGTSTYDFKDAAVGKFFKLEVRPYYLSETQLANASRYTKTIEFKVVDGYNVTDAKQLGILYNNKDDSTYDGSDDKFKFYDKWTTFLNEYQIERKDDIKGIILHNDITITAEDIPDFYFTEWDEKASRNDNGEYTNEKAVYTDPETGKKLVLVDGANGGACHETNIYCHYVAPGEGNAFSIYGNYFTLNAKLPTVDSTILPTWGSTTSLFRFISTYSGLQNNAATLGNPNDDQETKDAVNAAALASAESAVANIYNLNTVGNAPRTDLNDENKNPDSARIGGLIFVKGNAVNVNVYNSIVKAYSVNFYADERLSYLNLTDVKTYDAYQAIIYCKNGGHITINTSELKRSGGPAMILAAEYDSADERQETYVDIDEHSVIESWISGLEPWFSINGATTSAAQLKTAKDTFKNNFKVPASYVKKVNVQEGTDSDPELAQLVNVYLVNVYIGDATFEEGEGEDKKEVTAQVMSRVTIGGKVVIDTIGMNEEDFEEEGNKGLLYEEIVAGQQIFATTKGGIVSSSGTINSDAFTPAVDEAFIISMVQKGQLSMDAATSMDMDAIYAAVAQYYVLPAFGQTLLTPDEKDCLAIYVPGMSLVVDYFYSEIPVQPGQ